MGAMGCRAHEPAVSTFTLVTHVTSSVSRLGAFSWFRATAPILPSERSKVGEQVGASRVRLH